MLNKLDILTGLPELKVCVAYRVDGHDRRVALGRRRPRARGTGLPNVPRAGRRTCARAESMDDLPKQARRYMAAIEERAGVPITIVSVGPERTQTLVRRGSSLMTIHRAA